MARHGAEWWAKRVEEVAHGGDPHEIARRHGVRARTLLWWRSELRRRGREAPSKAPRLLPVVVRGAPHAVIAAEPSEDLELLVEIGDLRMTLRGAVTPEHLGAIVSASARAC
jgi:transposase-like protein